MLPLSTFPQVHCPFQCWHGFSHISIDYVFDGRNPPYRPESEANPLQDYGVTKFAGEKAVLSVNGAKVVVLRVPVL